ncbi:MAG: hypothetical protein K1X55_05635 [Chitinophagales bacterium]|nr:hypothetical protein [Chitinophagales bacterium]
MDIKEIPIDKLKDIELFDIIILHHGFETYNPDYYFIVETGTKENVGRFKIQFTHCFDLTYRHKFADIKFPDLIRKSWTDDLISSDVPQNENAYWWGQGFTNAYPGFSYDPDNVKAKEMAEITGRPMYAIHLETDHYEINFVFHDFRYIFLNPDTSISDKVFIPTKDFKFK